jgi:hypothetical protein
MSHLWKKVTVTSADPPLCVQLAMIRSLASEASKNPHVIQLRTRALVLGSLVLLGRKVYSNFNGLIFNVYFAFENPHGIVIVVV